MEYRSIWLVFLTLLFVLGGMVAAFPISVARFLRANRGLPNSNFLTAWRILGGIVAVGSLVKLAAVLDGSL